MLHPQRGRSNDTALLQSFCCNIHLQQEQGEDLRPFTALPRKRKYNKTIDDILISSAFIFFIAESIRLNNPNNAQCISILLPDFAW